MPDDWNSIMGDIGFEAIGDENLFGDLDEYGLLPPEADINYGQMMVGGGFGNLYYYELHNKKGQLKAKKYAVPVVGGKKGDFKFFVGETAEQAIAKYAKGREYGDVETTSDITKADGKLKEKHGTLGTDIWHVKVWKDLGPIEVTAAPSKGPGKKTIEEASAAVESASTEKELLAVEKAASASEILKTGKNTVYIIAGVGAAVVIGTVIIIFARHGTPTGRVAGLLAGRK